MTGAGAWRYGVAAAGLVAALTGCSPSNTGSDVNSDTAASPDDGALRPVELPDLSPMAESVRAQLSGAYARLREALADTDGEPVGLAELYGDLGKLLMAAQYFDAAEACYLNASALMPGDFRWPYYLGHLYRRTGDLDAATRFFETARQARPRDVVTLVWLGEVYLEADRTAPSESAFEDALALNPNSAAAAFGLGRAALARQDSATAVRFLERALALDGSASSMHYPLSLAYRGVGDLEAAERHLSLRGDVQVSLPDPLMQEVSELLESEVSYELSGASALARGDSESAITAFRRGVDLAPANPSIRHQLGTALALSGDTQGALREFEQVVAMAPDFTRGRLSLGVLLDSLGRRAEAVTHLEAAVRADPRSIDARLRLVQVLRQSGRFEVALSHLERALEADPRVAEVQFNHAMTLVQLRRYREARDRLAEGMQMHTDEPRFAHALARVLAAAPDDRARAGPQALEIVRDLTETERPSVALAETMAMALAEVGEYGEAAAWQRDAVAAATQAGRDDVALRMLDNLVLYERGEASRTPWRPGELQAN